MNKQDFYIVFLGGIFPNETEKEIISNSIGQIDNAQWLVPELLSRRFPKIRLRIASAHQKAGLRQDGYVRWLNSFCNELGVADRVDWLASLSAKQIVNECQNCSIFLMTSHIENCCTAMQEALYLRVLTVSAYAGGVPALACAEEAALYYSPGDEAMCAYQVERLLTDQDLAIRLARNARAVAVERNNPDEIVLKQLDIYRQVIKGGTGC